MYKDSDYFLNKAKYFRDKSKKNNLINNPTKSTKSTNNFISSIDDDEDLARLNELDELDKLYNSNEINYDNYEFNNSLYENEIYSEPQLESQSELGIELEYNPGLESGFESELESEFNPSLESEIDYEYIELQPVDIDELIREKTSISANVKPMFKRIYDPITKHYFSVDKIFKNQENDIPCEKNGIWYPEIQPRQEIFQDPKTGQYYRVNKSYDNNGCFNNKYECVKKTVRRRPGTNFYTITYDPLKSSK
ncbi:hypothetical protein QLL95_gp0699 [Cotonvirus japonicus]|uniref:Uncharacterized protein n=1 Tax=Cotonvirus japonicus TaxID=2811091 RepID=A0ABM7NTC6_9VIRU|nr:hypothetical protein QLL95_gp0699 [Cotonvirus japonicus]BCS83424.1 hypothetical protein [Cotonvirus japonicus]